MHHHQDIKSAPRRNEYDMFAFFLCVVSVRAAVQASQWLANMEREASSSCPPMESGVQAPTRASEASPRSSNPHPERPMSTATSASPGRNPNSHHDRGFYGGHTTHSMNLVPVHRSQSDGRQSAGGVPAVHQGDASMEMKAAEQRPHR